MFTLKKKLKKNTFINTVNDTFTLNQKHDKFELDSFLTAHVQLVGHDEGKIYLFLVLFA